MATVTVTKALDLADEFRSGRATCRPIDLWRLADQEAAGTITVRCTLYRHAMVHAGYLMTAKGSPYKRCPMCQAPLHR